MQEPAVVFNGLGAGAVKTDSAHSHPKFGSKKPNPQLVVIHNIDP